MNALNVDTKAAHELFEQCYIGLRAAEQRLYTDEEVKRLPEIEERNIYKREWEIRKASCRRLVHYLERKQRSLKILEVGCGNGWLSHQLSKMAYANVIGVDVNGFEIEQAQRVFGDIPNLDFIYGDLDVEQLEFQKFDIIIFAASVQYFKSLNEIIELSLEKLKENGEIHILDSPFYKGPELAAAKKRSFEYFKKLGFENMDGFYFHHSIEALKMFNYRFLLNPGSVANKVLRRKTPFYWISIRK
jgi:SAM-dependent methyltransferase